MINLEVVQLFIKLKKEDVHGIARVEVGRDKPIGDVYINTDDISHIDGSLVVVGDYNIACTEKALEKVLSVSEVFD